MLWNLGTLKKIVIRRCRKVYKSEKCFPVMSKSIEFNETFKVYSRQEDFVKLWDIDWSKVVWTCNFSKSHSYCLEKLGKCLKLHNHTIVPSSLS